MPEKLEMRTKNIAGENIDKIADMFPNCITESLKDGKIIRSVDFDALKQELSNFIVDGPAERYQFTWPDKSKAKLLANTPINMTLRPCPKESVDFDNTKNLYIEGDNLDVLKLLRETYLGKVKMIYIDPPYNTGNDFVYEDDFKITANGYTAISGDFDEKGNKLEINPSSNGRFHTDWLNMIYPRLKISRDLLKDDGAIFISIDDNEIENLIKICDEIFGQYNHVATIIWEKKYSPANDAKWFSDNHDFIVIYAKNKDKWHPRLLPRTSEMNSRYTNKDNDPRGVWKSSDLTVKSYSSAYDYPITTPSGKIVNPSEGRCWTTSEDNFKKLVADNRIWFGENGDNSPSLKKFLTEVQDGVVPMTIWRYDIVGHTQEGRQELKKLFGDKGYFDGPKPTKLIKRMLYLSNMDADSIVVDFFSGSSSTAQAVMDMNHSSGNNTRFIMVQLPEQIEQNTEAYADGYRTICDIGKERIRLAGKIIQVSQVQSTLDKQSKTDVGFRVLRLDSSNMKDVFYSPDQTHQSGLDSFLDNVKEDRKPRDLLFQCMLDLGIELSASINNYKIDGKDVYDVDNGYLLACFDTDISESVVTEIAKKKPVYAVMRDSSMSSDSMATNFEQVFKSYSPTTIRKVL